MPGPWAPRRVGLGRQVSVGGGVAAVSAFCADLVEVISIGRRAAAREHFALAKMLHATKLRVDALAVGVVLRPKLKARVDVVAAEQQAVSLAQFVALPIERRRPNLRTRADEQVALEAFIVRLGV